MRKYILHSMFLAAAMLFTAGLHAQVIVIANPSVKATVISKNDLRDVFTGSLSSLKDGSHVTPVLLKGGTANNEFLSEYIGKNDVAFRAGWRSLVFSGQGSMPKSLESEAAVVEFVTHNSGAIGYIGKSIPHEGVKILTIR
jgi:ABC-type phosphate transport system substrate-binding protein